MRYAYLIFMNPQGLNGKPTQGKTLLGVHSSIKSAVKHFNGVVDDRQQRRDYDHVEWFLHSEITPTDWCYRRIRAVWIHNKKPEPGTCPDWYALSEHIIMEQWKVSSTKARKQQPGKTYRKLE